MRKPHPKPLVNQFDPVLGKILDDYQTLSQEFDLMTPKQKAKAIAWCESLPAEDRDLLAFLGQMSKGLGP